MNSDDLEERLSKWQPADAPVDLMRRLRAAKPPRSEWCLSFRFFAEGWWPWKLAGLTLLMALGLIVVVQLRSASRPLEVAKSPRAERLGDRTAATSTLLPLVESALKSSRKDARTSPGGRDHEPVLNLRDFPQGSLRYALLGNAWNADAGDRLALDSPVSLVRLDCGHIESTGKLSGDALSRFHFNAGDQF